MADPVVTMTNGIPTSSVPAVGTITTLGMTLLDGANATLGATTDSAIVAGAAGTINAHLRSISRDIAGGIVLQAGGANIGSVSQAGAPWSQNVTQFGGTSISTGVGIGGAGIPRVTVSSDSSLAATQSGSWDVRNITGTVALPTGASVASKQPALGTAGVPSADVITVQGISGMVALKVDGTGGTFPVSGTITANQGGTWNITNISGTVSLPTGAATAAKQPAPSTAGSPSADVLTVQGAAGMTALKVNISGNGGANLDFAGQNAAGTINAQLIGGQFNTTPTTITTGNFSPLQLDNTGNLLTNIKAGVPAIGTFGSAFPSTGYAIGAKDSTGTNLVALNLDASGFLKVNVAAGGASGGTSSNFGAAVPGTGTAAGFSDGTNMQLAHVWDGDTGAGTQWVQGVLLKTPASGGAVDIGVSGTPLRVDPTGTTTQPISGTVTVQQATAANLNATVTGTITANQGGTWNITNISGTISLPTGASTSANQPSNAALGSTTSGQTGTLSLGAVTSAAPTYTTATSNALSLTTSGALRVDGSATTQPISGTVNAAQSGTWNITNISGTVSLPTGAATSANQPTNVGIASTTSGQTGHLAMGATTTGAPAYTTGQSNPLSLSTAGALRVDGSGVTQPVSGTFWQATQPVSGTITANQGGNWTSRVVGNAGGIVDAAQNAAAPANEIVVGGVYNSTAPTLTSGNASQLQLDSSGNLNVNIKAGAGSGGTASTYGATFPSTGTAAGFSDGTNMQGARVFDEDTGAGTQYVLGVSLRAAGSGGSTEIGTSAAPLRTDPVGTTTQPVSGTVTANQGGTWTVQPGNTANTTPWLATINQGGNSATVTASNALKVDGSAVTQPISAAALPLPSGAATSANQPTNAALGSTTSGQTGGLALGAVTTAAPTYTTAQSNALSLTTAGALRVDGSGVTQPVSGTVAVSSVGGSVAVTGTFWQTTQPVSGTFWQATQPVSIAGTVAISAAALPLPAGASTSAGQTNPATYNAGTGWTSATALNTAAALANSTASTYETLVGQITQGSTITGGAITFEESFDNGATYVTIPPQRFVDPTTYVPLANPYTLVASTNQRFHIIPSSTSQVRARLSTVIAGTGTVTVSWTQSLISSVDLANAICAGDTPAGNTDAGWPVKIGGISKTTQPTVWTDGQRTGATFDKQGKLVAVGAIRQLKGVQKTSITVATETTVVTAGAAGVFNDVYALVVTNKSNTSVFVDFKDATAGTTRMTLAAPANDTRGFTVPVDSAMPQAAAANNWTATVSSAVTSIEITALYVSNL